MDPQKTPKQFYTREEIRLLWEMKDFNDHMSLHRFQDATICRHCARQSDQYPYCLYRKGYVLCHMCSRISVCSTRGMMSGKDAMLWFLCVVVLFVSNIK